LTIVVFYGIIIKKSEERNMENYKAALQEIMDYTEIRAEEYRRAGF
jgi:hypothetical protein